MFKQTVYERYRGFNLTDMFCSENSEYSCKNPVKKFSEVDFRLISEWGFNFVRLPLSYRIWSSADDPYKVDEEKIKPLDQALEYADKYNLFVSICLHRIPGYCVNDDEPIKEPFDLWKDSEALSAAKFQWSFLSERYKNISNERLSFNLINEPHYSISSAKIADVTEHLVRTVRNISPSRSILIDGTHNGSVPPIDIMMIGGDNIGYSCRGYQPSNLTHIGAPWVKAAAVPKWPDGGVRTMGSFEYKYGLKEMEEYFDMWAALGNIYNAGIICGELGCICNTPHDRMLSWINDIMRTLKSRNIGYALWNFKSPNFGLVNNSRTDAVTKKYGDYYVDEELLHILQRY